MLMAWHSTTCGLWVFMLTGTSIEFLKIWWKLIHGHYFPHHIETLWTFLFLRGLKPPTHIGFLSKNQTTQYSLEFDMDAKDMNFQIKSPINSKMKWKLIKISFYYLITRLKMFKIIFEEFFCLVIKLLFNY